ncbi:MAG: ATP-dependent helicase [Elusimicrobia bacterium]|nr:ATP-dependent helicase [Elusimicrobiota bacterium]
MRTVMDNLTESQKRAIAASGGEFVVKAGAGTGKTRVLVNKYLEVFNAGILSGMTPEETAASILTVTFTKRAAKEMTVRLAKAIGDEQVRNSSISTIDAFCLKFLKENAFLSGFDPDFKVLDEIESKLIFRKVSARILEEEVSWSLDIDHSREAFMNDAFALINSLKQRMISPEKFIRHKKDNEELHRTIYLLYRAYEEHIEKENNLDFSKLLTLTYLVLKDNAELRQKIQSRYMHVLVDEYQDTNPAQVALLRLIAQPQNNYFVVGDEKQSIYGFRGAQPRHIVEYFKDLPDENRVILNHNFRSPEPIPSLVNSIFKDQLDDYHPIESRAEGRANVELFLADDKLQEADFTANRVREFLDSGYAPHDIVVLFRGVKNCREYEDALRKLNIDTITVGGMGFYLQPEIKDMLSILIVIDNPYSERDLFRMLGSPVFGIPDSEIAQIASMKEKGETLYHALMKYDSENAGRIKEFISYFRKRKINLTLMELIGEIIESSGLLYWASSKPGGRYSRQMSNLNKFIHNARYFESRNIFTTLADFVDYLRQLEEADIVEPEARPRAKGLVHLMSIHQSKGLEFPIVFISNVSCANFPAQKRMDRYHFYEKHGLVIRDNSSESYYEKNIKGMLYAQHNQEERRLLYVAMTRAKEHLVISGYGNSRKKTSSFMEYFLEAGKDGYTVKKEIKGHLNYIKNHMSAAEDALPARKVTGSLIKKFSDASSSLGIPRYFKDREIPGEFSVTQVETYAKCPNLYYLRYVLRIPEVPPDEGFSPQLFGSVIHRMLQEYYILPGMDEVSKMKAKAVSLIITSGITSDCYNKYYREPLEAITGSLKGSVMLKAKRDVLFTEKPFALKIGGVLIKGTIDRLDRAEGGAELIDYKTSKSTGTKEHSLQVGIYKLAAETVLGQKVKKISLYFLRNNKIAAVRGPAFLQLKLKSIIEGMRNEIFFPFRSEMCGFCPYSGFCGRGGKLTKKS